MSGLEVTYGDTFSFTGEVFLAADSAKLFPGTGSKFTASITDGPDAGTEAVRATLTFTGSTPDGFKFIADQFSFKFGTLLTISGSNITIDSGAASDEEVVSFESLGVKITAGTLQIGGEMRNFAFLGNGSFRTKAGFGIFVDTNALTGSSVGWAELDADQGHRIQYHLAGY